MEKINFINGQAPYINDTNLNQLQTNIEEAIDAKSSLPSGGTTGQVLGKQSNADNDVAWIDQTGGGSSATGDTLPIGSIVDYDGTIVPTNWEEVEEEGEIYSTEEMKVGTWIDGKTIYRKVFTLPNLTASGTSLIHIGMPIGEINYDKITRIEGVATITDGVIPIPYLIGAEQFVTCFFDSNQNTIYVYDRSYTTTDIKIILEYTKTTD